MLRVEFLFWQKCPSHPRAWERLQEVLGETGIEADVHRIEVRTEEEAGHWGFRGSPTLRVNGLDIDPDGVLKEPVGLNCRLYFNASGQGGPLPSKELIQKALKKGEEGARHGAWTG